MTCALVACPLVSVREVDVEQLAEALAYGASGDRLIDVREVDEYVEAHVPGAELIVLATVPQNIDRFRTEGTTYVICRSGARSMRAARFLADQGVESVNVAGGTLA